MKLSVKRYPADLGDSSLPWYVANEMGDQVSEQTFETNIEACKELIRLMAVVRRNLENIHRKKGT